MTPYTRNPHKLCAELTTDKVGLYLVSQGYLLVQWVHPVVIYKRPTDPPESAVEVPLDPALRDYGRRMYETLQDLDGAFLGLLHAIDPDKFPTERILVLAGVTV